MKTIKVSEETYAALCRIAGELQVELKRPVSLDEAVRHLLSLKEGGSVRLTDLAGTWDMTDEEWAEIKASLERAWRRWVPLSVQ